MIWASPPCTEYSCAKTVGVRDIDKANDIVLRTISVFVLCVCPRWAVFCLPKEDPTIAPLYVHVFILSFSFYPFDNELFSL